MVMTSPKKEIVLVINELLKDAITGLPEPVQINVREALFITEDIDKEVDEAAGWYGYYAVMAEKAAFRLMRMELSFEMWKEERATAKRNELAALGHKSLTGPRMLSYLKSLANYRAYEVQITEYTFERDVLRKIANAFEMKKDLVQSKSANRRNASRSGTI